jgi:RsiW-degrading membrane proteinase PrsW (M82 family)
MSFTVLFVPILLPVLFWSGYHYYKDRHQPEPLQNLLFCFLLGIAASYLSKFMYVALETVNLRMDAYELAATNLWHLLAYSIFVIGGIEETAKLAPFLLFAIRFKAFDENLDGIIYASFIALGYAAMENYHYLQFLTEREAMYRGFAGPLVHILFASVWGYRIGVARLAGRPLLLVSFVAVTIAAVLHGLYDFIVIALPISALPLSALLILAVWIWRLIAIRRMKRLAGHID